MPFKNINCRMTIEQGAGTLSAGAFSGRLVGEEASCARWKSGHWFS